MTETPVAEAPAQESPSALLEEVRKDVKAVRDAQTALHEAFEDKIHFDRAREAQLDRLHAELQRHKDDLLARVQLPILRDLIAVHDDLAKLLAHWEELPAERREWPALRRSLGTFAEQMVDVLSRYGVSPYEEEDAAFNPKTQRAVRAVPTPEAALDRRVARRVRPGYRYNERPLRPEEVDVYRYVPSPQPGAGAADKET